MSCDCKKKCGENCSCVVNNLKCTDICSFKDCENIEAIEVDDEMIDEYNDDYDSDNEY